MEKKTECEIVQDLLLGYVDEILNNESKKLVESHLKECVNCQNRLQEINLDINNNEKNQKKEIDYLKKIRRKTRIKSILFVFGIIIFLIFSIFIYKLVILNNLISNSIKTLETNNYYRETVQMMGNNETALTRQFYKDGKFKRVYQIYSDAGVQNLRTEYGEVNSDELIVFDETTNTVKVNKGEMTEMFNKEENVKNNYFHADIEYLTIRLGKPLVMDIKKDTYDIGREYYVFRNLFETQKRWEVWIDKETGLILREINKEGYKTYFPASSVVREIRDNIMEYKYEFDIVKDEDVKPIDITNYEVEYVNTDIDEICKNS